MPLAIMLLICKAKPQTKQESKPGRAVAEQAKLVLGSVPFLELHSVSQGEFVVCMLSAGCYRARPRITEGNKLDIVHPTWGVWPRERQAEIKENDANECIIAS